MSAPVKDIAILGSTGSIGTSTLDICRRFPDRFRVVALAAGENDELLAEQIREFEPRLVSMKSEAALSRLQRRLQAKSLQELPELLAGEAGALAVAEFERAEIVVSAFVGAAGLKPTMAALRRGCRVALANKEALVIAGRVMIDTANRYGAEILPVDSEHSAIFQCLQGHRKEDIDRIILTASGGPFLHKDQESLKNVTVADALAHPVWSMGAKITIDSATLMNKGFEAIEAHWLFDVAADQIEVRIHPQCIDHSMVAYVDGSVIAQLGASDMRGPISYALAYPERLPLPFHRLALPESAPWEFFVPRQGQFLCLELAFQAMAAGDGYPAVLNAANEVAVAAFLNGSLPFLGIAEINRQVLQEAIRTEQGERIETLEELLVLDQYGREQAKRRLQADDVPN